MSFLAPGFLIAAGVAALAVIGLHFLSTREPKLELLPTVRFLPDRPVRAKATTLRPTDPWLMLLRVLVVMLIGMALARPVLMPSREPVARIVAVDISRAVGDPAELADSASRYVDGAAAVIVFDSTAREVANGAQAAQAAGRASAGGVPPRIQDSTVSGAAPWQDGTMSRGSLSGALVAARRAAARIRDRADSLELVIVSPFAAEEYDAATDRVRSLWPGRVTAVSVSPAVARGGGDSIRVEWADSVASAAAVASTEPDAEADVDEDVEPADIEPTDVEPAGEAVARYWTAREPADTVAAVRAGDAVLVYPFVRRWDAAPTEDGETRVIARWADGEPAAIERPLTRSGDAESGDTGATGCVRSFGFSLPTAGDALLRPEFQRFLESLDAPCGGPRDFAPLSADVMASLEGEGALAATAAIERRVQRATPLAPWLLLAGALLAVLELIARRRSARAARTAGQASDRAQAEERIA